MIESFLNGKVMLYPGDCREVLKERPDNSVDSVVCDPPYHLQSIVKRFAKVGRTDKTWSRSDPHQRHAAGFMNKKWDGGDVSHDVELWREVWRVLKPGGYVVAFGGTRTYHRLASAIENAGFEIRDSVADFIASDTRVVDFIGSLNEEQFGAFARCIDESQFGGMLHWVFGSGFPKSHNVGANFDKSLDWFDADELDAGMCSHFGAYYEGHGTALKPACEPICLARKQLSEKTVAANVLRWGTGAINIDGCRVATDENLNGGAYAVDGGRAMLAGDERIGAAAGMFQSGKTTEREFTQPQGRWPANVIHDGSDEVLAGFPDLGKSTGGRIGNAGGGTVANLPTGVFEKGDPGFGDSGSAARFFYTAKADADDRIGSKHPTVKPVNTMQWLVRLVTPKGGTVLDPFAGTGTTGEAAFREGCNAILIEREGEYQDDIRRRMALVLAGPEERARQSAKAKMKDKPVDPGPLFEWMPP